MAKEYLDEADEEELVEFEEEALERRAKLNQKWQTQLNVNPMKINKVLRNYAKKGVTSPDEKMAKLEQEHPNLYSFAMFVETFSSPDCVGNRWHKPCLEARAIMYNGLKD